ncbi:MAG: DNA-binding protein [Paucibacter sp.]|nr:DNA-binding protein [Roseateles sp.]
MIPCHPLAAETRAYVATDVAAAYLNHPRFILNRWASENLAPIKPALMRGRLAWSVHEIRRVLGLAQEEYTFAQ